MRRPVVFLTISVALLVSAAVPVYDLELGPGTNQGIPQDLESTLGLNILAEAAGEGALAPTELVIDTGVADGIRTPRFSELSIGFVKVSPPIQRSEPSASGRAPASSTRRAATCISRSSARGSTATLLR